MTISLKAAASDNMTVEKLLAPPISQLPETSIDNPVSNHGQPSSQPVHHVVETSEKGTAVASTFHVEHNRTRSHSLPDESMSSFDNLPTGQRSILSNIQNTGQPQLSVPQKSFGKVLTRGNKIAELSTQDYPNDSQSAGSVSQNSTGLLQRNELPVTASQGNALCNPHIDVGKGQQRFSDYYERTRVQNDINHGQTNRNALQSICRYASIASNISNENRNFSQMNPASLGTHRPGNSTLVRSTNEIIDNMSSHIIGGKNQVVGNSTPLDTINEPHVGQVSQATSHVESGVNHVLSSCKSTTSVDEPCIKFASHTSSHVLQSTSSNNAPHRNSLMENTSIRQRPFNLIDFISNNSSDKCYEALPADASTNQECTRTDIFANKTALDGQTALLENIMGFEDSSSDSLTLPLTPKGSCGSGYGLGLDVDEFLNSEDGRKM